MFTGLIKEIGKIAKLEKNESGATLKITCPKIISEIQIGDSIAVSGVCLTATNLEKDAFSVQMIHTTLEKSSLVQASLGSSVNLELALRASDRLGGHFVQGHVNTTAKVSKIEAKGGNYLVSFEIESAYQKYISQEGSIAIDGTSLTIAYVGEKGFTISIIPHTWDETIFHTYKVGTVVNIEVDCLMKYVENLLKHQNVKY